MSLRSSWAASIGKNVTKVSLPELDLGMERNLWGLTMWLWSYSLQMARRNLVEEKGEKKLIEQLKVLTEHAEKL